MLAALSPFKRTLAEVRAAAATPGKTNFSSRHPANLKSRISQWFLGEKRSYCKGEAADTVFGRDAEGVVERRKARLRLLHASHS